MTSESLGTGDGASIIAPRHHTLIAASHLTGSLIAPADVFGHTVEELFDLHHTRYHGGDPVVAAASIQAALAPSRNSIRLRVHDAEGHLKQLILDHNCRTNTGSTWQMNLMGGDTNANIGYENHSGAVAYTSTTVTPTASPTWTINQWVGHQVIGLTTIGATPTVVYGNIISNTATALTIDQWTSFTSVTGAAGATPAANSSFSITPGQAPSFWIAVSTSSTTEDIGDTTLTSELNTGFSVNPRWKSVFSITTAASGTGTTNATVVYKIDSGVQTSNATNTIAKIGVTAYQTGGTMYFTKKLTVAASLQNLDTLDSSQAVTLS